MSPTVPLSFFRKPLESSPPKEPTAQPSEDPTGCAAMSPEELAEQIRVQLLEDCGPLSTRELADEKRIREEIKVAEVFDRPQHSKPAAPVEAKRRVSEELRPASSLRRNSESRPGTAWAKAYQRLN